MFWVIQKKTAESLGSDDKNFKVLIEKNRTEKKSTCIKIKIAEK